VQGAAARGLGAGLGIARPGSGLILAVVAGLAAVAMERDPAWRGEGIQGCGCAAWRRAWIWCTACGGAWPACCWWSGQEIRSGSAGGDDGRLELLLTNGERRERVRGC